MADLYLQKIIDDIPFENLPAKWQGFDFGRFSKDFSMSSNAQTDSKNLDYKLIYKLIKPLI